MPKQSRKIRVNKKRSGTSPKKYYKKKNKLHVILSAMVSIAFFPLLKKSSPPGEQVCALNIFIVQKSAKLKKYCKGFFQKKIPEIKGDGI